MTEGREFKGKVFNCSQSCPKNIKEQFDEPFTAKEFEYALSKDLRYQGVTFRDCLKAGWLRRVKAWISVENLPSSYVEETTPMFPIAKAYNPNPTPTTSSMP